MANPRVVSSTDDCARVCGISVEECKRDVKPPFQSELSACNVSAWTDIHSVAPVKNTGQNVPFASTLLYFHRLDGSLDESARVELDSIERCDRQGFLRIMTKNNSPHYTVVPAAVHPAQNDLVMTADGFIGPLVKKEKNGYAWIICLMRDTSYDEANLFMDDPQECDGQVAIRRYKPGMCVPLTHSLWVQQMNKVAGCFNEAGINYRNLMSLFYHGTMNQRMHYALHGSARSSSPIRNTSSMSAEKKPNASSSLSPTQTSSFQSGSVAQKNTEKAGGKGDVNEDSIAPHNDEMENTENAPGSKAKGKPKRKKNVAPSPETSADANQEGEKTGTSNAKPKKKKKTTSKSHENQNGGSEDENGSLTKETSGGGTRKKRSSSVNSSGESGQKASKVFHRSPDDSSSHEQKKPNGEENGEADYVNIPNEKTEHHSEKSTNLDKTLEEEGGQNSGGEDDVEEEDNWGEMSVCAFPNDE
jgi:hypothetical protein